MRVLAFCIVAFLFLAGVQAAEYGGDDTSCVEVMDKVACLSNSNVCTWAPVMTNGTIPQCRDCDTYIVGDSGDMESDYLGVRAYAGMSCVYDEADVAGVISRRYVTFGSVTPSDHASCADSTNPPTDWTSLNLDCKAITCEENQYVMDNVCHDCAVEGTNEAGDMATGPDTECEMPQCQEFMTKDDCLAGSATRTCFWAPFTDSSMATGDEMACNWCEGTMEDGTRVSEYKAWKALAGLSCDYTDYEVDSERYTRTFTTVSGPTECRDSDVMATDMTPRELDCEGEAATAEVEFSTQFAGVTAATFDQGGFITSIATTTGADETDVTVDSVIDVVTVVRRLLANSVDVKYTVGGLTDAEAATAVTAVETATEANNLFGDLVATENEPAATTAAEELPTYTVAAGASSVTASALGFLLVCVSVFRL